MIFQHPVAYLMDLLINYGYINEALLWPPDYAPFSLPDLRDAFAQIQPLLKKCEIKVGRNSTDTVIRHCLRPEAIRMLLTDDYANTPLGGITLPLSSRGKLDTQSLSRLVRSADVEQMMRGIPSVETVFTASMYTDYDPFLFGYPACNYTMPVLHREVTQALVQHVQTNPRSAQLPRWGALYISNADIPASKPLDVHGAQLKSFNNALGLLLDFEHRITYMVFYCLDKSLKWAPANYDAYRTRLRPQLDSLNFDASGGHYPGEVYGKALSRGASNSGLITRAIVLCNSEAQARNHEKHFRSMRSPFYDLFFFALDDSIAGRNRLHSLLLDGPELYVRESFQMAYDYSKRVSGTTLPPIDCTSSCLKALEEVWDAYYKDRSAAASYRMVVCSDDNYKAILSIARTARRKFCENMLKYPEIGQCKTVAAARQKKARLMSIDLRKYILKQD